MNTQILAAAAVGILATAHGAAQNAAPVRPPPPEFSVKGAARLTFAQSAMSDWFEGEKSSFEVRLGLNDLVEARLGPLQSRSTFRLNLGVMRERSEHFPDGVTRSTDNELFAETVISLPLGFVVDPYIGASLKTPVTESHRLMSRRVQRIANFWDPVTSQQSVGMSFRSAGTAGSAFLRLGITMQQIRARNNTMLSDDPYTPKIAERYRTKSGFEFVGESRLALDSSVNYIGRMSLISNDLQQLDRWRFLWENEARFRLWKLLGVVLTVNLTSDPAQSSRLQFRQAIQIGIIQDH